MQIDQIRIHEAMRKANQEAAIISTLRETLENTKARGDAEQQLRAQMASLIPISIRFLTWDVPAIKIVMSVF